MVFVIHQHKSAIHTHMSPPSWNLLPPPSLPHTSRLSQSTGFEFPASYSELPLAIYFTYRLLTFRFAPSSLLAFQMLLWFLVSEYGAPGRAKKSLEREEILKSWISGAPYSKQTVHPTQLLRWVSSPAGPVPPLHGKDNGYLPYLSGQLWR